MEVEQKKKRMTRGGRNLVVLGIVCIVLSLITTGISLIVYHNSGDIYLDRSRPGFLPDEEEIEEEEEKEEYIFEKSGKLTVEIIEEYLEKLQTEVKAIDSYSGPFDSGTLSNSRLGIPDAEPEE